MPLLKRCGRGIFFCHFLVKFLATLKIVIFVSVLPEDRAASLNCVNTYLYLWASEKEAALRARVACGVCRGGCHSFSSVRVYLFAKFSVLRLSVYLRHTKNEK